MSVLKVEFSHLDAPRGAVAQVDDIGPSEDRCHVGSVPAGVHPDSASDRAGNSDGPLEARQAGLHGSAGDDGQAGRASGDHHRASDIHALESVAELQGQSCEAPVCHQQVRSTPDHGDRHRCSGQCGSDRFEFGAFVWPHVHRRRSPDPVGRHRAEWMLASTPLTEHEVVEVLGQCLESIAQGPVSHRAGLGPRPVRRSGRRRPS